MNLKEVVLQHDCDWDWSRNQERMHGVRYFVAPHICNQLPRSQSLAATCCQSLEREQVFWDIFEALESHIQDDVVVLEVDQGSFASPGVARVQEVGQRPAFDLHIFAHLKIKRQLELV